MVQALYIPSHYHTGLFRFPVFSSGTFPAHTAINMPLRWFAVVFCCLQFVVSLFVIVLRNCLLSPLIAILVSLHKVWTSCVSGLMNGYDSGLSAKILISEELEVLRRNIKNLLADCDDVCEEGCDETFWDALSDDHFLIPFPHSTGNKAVVFSQCNGTKSVDFDLPKTIKAVTLPKSNGRNISHVDYGELHEKSQEGILSRYQSYQHALRRNSKV